MLKGYEFDFNDTVVMINGEQGDFYGISRVWAGMEVSYLFTEEIASAEFLGVQKPEAGATIDVESIKVPEGANYYVDVVEWVDNDSWEVVTGTFEKGKDYQLCVELVPDDGYHFYEEMTLTIGDETIEDIYPELTYAEYYAYYSLKEVIESIDIVIDEPVIGNAPDTEIEAEGYSAEILRYDSEGDEIEVFEDGQRYTLEINLAPAEGYCFKSGAPITKIELNGVTLPEVGKEATVEGITLPENAGYVLGMIDWLESDSDDLENGEWLEAEVFAEDKYYALAVFDK